MNPKTSIALAASGYFVMAVVVLVNLAIANRDPNVEARGGLLFMACVAFALLTFRLPLLTTSLGSIVFVVTLVKFVGGSVQSGEAAHNPVGFTIASLVSAYMALSMVQGFAVSVRPQIPAIREAARKLFT